MSARISALKALSRRAPNSEELDKIFAEILAEKQDRSCVFLGAAAVEWILAELVKVHMIPLSGNLEEALFGHDGPVSTFSRLIRVSHAFDLIDDNLARELNYIREIRNAFAHATMAIDFMTKEVGDVCELFKNHLNAYEGGLGSLSIGRQKYIGSVIAAMQEILTDITKEGPRISLARALQEQGKRTP